LLYFVKFLITTWMVFGYFVVIYTIIDV